MDIRKALENLSRSLRNNPLVSDLSVKDENPVLEDYYDIIESQFDCDARRWFSKIHDQADGFSMFWKYKDRDGSVLPGGEIGIQNLLTIFDDNSEVLSERFAYQDDWPDEVKSIVYPLRPFDVYQEAVDGLEFVAIDWHGHEEEKMWLWTLDAVDRYLLDLRLEDYLQRAFEAKGCVFWQYFFVDTENMNFSDPIISEYFASSFDDALRRMEYCINIMNTVFPEEDFSIFQERYEKVKKVAAAS